MSRYDRLIAEAKACAKRAEQLEKEAERVKAEEASRKQREGAVKEARAAVITATIDYLDKVGVAIDKEDTAELQRICEAELKALEKTLVEKENRKKSIDDILDEIFNAMF